MDILQLLAPGPFGGLERVVTQLATGLARRAHRVRAALVVEQEQEQEPALAGALREAGVETDLVRPPHRAYRLEQRLVRDLLARHRPSLVHTHGYHADVLLRPVAQDLAIPVLSTVHGFTGGGAKNRLFEWLERRSLRRMNAVIAVSAPLARRLRRSGVPADRLHVIRNAYAPPGAFLSREAARQRLGLDPDARVIGWVGRVSPEKGPDVMMQALSKLATGDAQLCLIGQGRMRDRVGRLAAESGLGQRVRWAGSVSDAWQLFRAFDVYCLTSYTEGTPMVVMEAMAAGVPVVATAVGGVPDVLSADEGWLCPPGDPALLAAALDQALQDPGSRPAAAGRRLASEFGIDPWLNRYEEVYRMLASETTDRA